MKKHDQMYKNQRKKIKHTHMHIVIIHRIPAEHKQSNNVINVSPISQHQEYKKSNNSLYFSSDLIDPITGVEWLCSIAKT